MHAADPGGLLVINRIDPIAIVFTLPEEVVQEINDAQRASHEPLTVEAYPRVGDKPLGTGRLVLLNNQIDTSTGTVQLKAQPIFPMTDEVVSSLFFCTLEANCSAWL